MRTARLALADGTVLHGTALGAEGEALGEVVFNTSMTGYEEILTDPSYAGQIVTMTYPEIGNYGFNGVDGQGDKPLATGLIVRNACPVPSNYRATESLDGWLRRQNITAISGIDTRALTRKLRTSGAMMGLISTDEEATDEALSTRAKTEAGMEGRDLATVAGTREAFDWTEGLPHVIASEPPPNLPGRFRIALVDFGVKRNILRQIVAAGAKVVRVFPFTASTEEILAWNPDGIVLSNGPGDPAAVPGAQELVRSLVGQKPVLGICLGHQILSLALGGKTYKLKFGHRGGNHPVFDHTTGKVEITAQNHGFAVDAASLEGKATITHKSLFDGTVEGLEVPGAKCFSVQYHPEAAPGPSDSEHLFRRFMTMVEAN